MKTVTIIDYQLGNIFSIVKAFEFLNCKVKQVDTPGDIDQADYLVLPGVGSFGDGIGNLAAAGFIPAIKEHVSKGKPFLGVCLGMQLLLSNSEEFGYHEGLNIIPGKVIKLPDEPKSKIPNIGWHTLQLPGQKSPDYWNNTVLQSIPADKDFYFIHSYAVYPASTEHCLSMSKFGNHEFCSTVKMGNVYGCQFHPEKSGETGLDILRNFISLVA